MFQVAQQCKENIYAIQTLKDFQHLEENKDQGINVREKAKAVVALLKDDDRYYYKVCCSFSGVPLKNPNALQVKEREGSGVEGQREVRPSSSRHRL